MNDKITYHQQVSYCGKPRCKRCREGIGHGPYWYAYQTIDGRTSRTYIGKHLPPEAEKNVLGNQTATTNQATELDQAVLRVYTLGQFRLERRDTQRDALDWHPVNEASWQHQRVRALLGCLVSVGGRKLGREQIMDALWPDLDTETAGSRLDRAVYSLRQVFEPSRARPATSDLLKTEREVITLADTSHIWVDADAFEVLIAKAHELKDGGEDLGKKEQLLKEAADLYGGDFLLEDQRNSWTRARRESLKRSWIGLQLELADLMIDRDALTSAIDPLDKLIYADPSNEAGVQRLMIVLEKLGRRGEALRSYKKLAHVLQQEYNIAPLPDTRKLYEDLLRGTDKTERSTEVTSEPVTRGTTTSASSGSGSEAPAIQIGRTHQSPLVGREQELVQLRELIISTEQAARFRLGSQRRSAVATLDPHRRPQCILLMGDVGIGKTRLAEELGREAKKRNWAVAWSRVYAQEGTIPYRLWTEVLRKAMEQGIWQRQEVKRRPLVFQSLGTLLPEIHDLLPAVNFPTSLSPEQEQLRLWEAARELLTLISESTPLLIALDDLQWADSSSCDLLAYLARRTYGYPIVIIGTCRENELAPDHALRPLLTDLRRENAVEVIGLEPLSQDQITSLVEQVSHASEPIIEKITERAGGNPFFAEELARTIVESQPLPLMDPESQLLPDTINAVLELRMARLSRECQLLLQKAAVLGGSFEFQVISEMEAAKSDYDEDKVLLLLEEALRSGMLTEEGSGTRITYHFWHPLLASFLYEEKLSAARRASQHRRAAAVFQKMYKKNLEAKAALITFHLVNGGADDETIAHFAELAGNNALALSSYREAEENYRIAFEHLGTDYTDWQRISFLLERLGECARIRGEFETARKFYEQALAIHLRHSNSLSVDYKQEVQVQAMLLWGIGATWYNQGDLTNSKSYIEQGEQVLRKVGITNGLAWASLKLQQSYVSWREGNYDETRRTANEALELFMDVLEQHIPNYDNNSLSYLSLTKRALNRNLVDVGKIHTLLSNVEAASGRCEEALPYLNKALAIAEQHSSKKEIAIINCNIGDIYIRTAEYSRAQAALRRSYSLAESINDKLVEVINLFNMGLIYIRTGNLKEAVDEVTKAITISEIIKDKSSISLFYAYLAYALLEQGQDSDAKTALYNSLNIGRKTHVSIYIGNALVTLGYMRFIQCKQMILTGSKELSLKLLKKAKTTLMHAIAFKGIEAETRIEGKVILAEVLIQLGDIEGAYNYSMQALEEAERLNLEWLITRSHHALGNVAVAQGLYDQSVIHYKLAEKLAQRKGMRLEYGRILHHYGLSLLNLEKYEEGVLDLKEANKIFEDCSAMVDLNEVSLVILSHKSSMTKA
ncbi:DUF6788 family protein [Dictyobacter arantiisoli]|uniref:Bacterial transcriptional activator domain-containing protein n=1 Tax=Dictyobacter arantiisoli TaxID=2014874 RepID=A0A5A5T639_9CHLR|nr:DUF6788 family protein [Dictyobacter arantiisoli]GCF06911.1 hypothetical protein KDI_04750 [Dictyobacter arantiisoli]